MSIRVSVLRKPNQKSVYHYLRFIGESKIENTDKSEKNSNNIYDFQTGVDYAANGNEKCRRKNHSTRSNKSTHQWNGSAKGKLYQKGVLFLKFSKLSTKRETKAQRKLQKPSSTRTYDSIKGKDFLVIMTS